MASMKPLALAACFLLGCLDQEPIETNEVEAQIAPLAPQGNAGQGTTMQGTTMQGTTMQGTTMQGTTMQGSSLDGATLGSTALSDATIGGTAIYFWKKVKALKTYTWEYRSPTRICKYNAARTQLLEPCTNYALANSPVVGSVWPTTFTAPDGSLITVKLRIEAVHEDPTTAMHGLWGSDFALPYTFVSCDNPRLCRKNRDIFNYDVRAIDVVDSNGQNPWLCPAGQTAIALAGRWQPDGTYLQSAPSFTFACTNGVIAKCTRWGYRPYDRSIRANDPNSLLIALRGYHQTCIRAAMADYCGKAHSFTKDGTLVDIYDYEGTEMGFVPQTLSAAGHDGPITAFAHEGRFDQRGATFIDDTRYHELVSLPAWNPEVVCPGTFAIGVDNDEFYHYSRVTPFLGPFMVVNSAPMCAHSELKTGKWLHRECSWCTNAVPAHCNDPASSQGWDQACVNAVLNNPTCMGDLSKRMALHSECATGAALEPYDSGCTLRVCGTPGYESCCSNTGSWTQACVNQADAVCTGGNERRPVYGFCSSSPLPPTPPLPPIGFN